MSAEIPILMCVFNRPGLTAHVLQSVARQRPRQLLIAGDGPRPDYPDDVALVERTRRIVERINWDCEVEARFSATNLGCRQHMAQAITWAFERHERLIILEDDCLPNDSFFTFCGEMLERYADNQRVMMVSGNTYPTGGFGEHSYRFSKYPLIWGWASWRRAWNHYDLGMANWQDPAIQQRVLDQFTCGPDERAYWQAIFDRQHAGEINTWDYSWTFACWANRGLAILPRQNLVSNLGFGDSATHTFDAGSPMANRQTFPLEVTSHPLALARDEAADQIIRRIVFEPDNAVSGPKGLRERKSLMSRLLNLPATKLFQQ